MLTALKNHPHPFSLDSATLMDILRHAKPLGHHEDPPNLNLGFGFLYYGLVRTLRPRHVVVIGSGYGFSVVCLALGLKDNGRGMLTFVDPSYSVVKDGPFRTIGGTSQWDDPVKVAAHFGRFGVERYVTHYRATSEAFFAAYLERQLPPIDVAFIDGNHRIFSRRCSKRAGTAICCCTIPTSTCARWWAMPASNAGSSA